MTEIVDDLLDVSRVTRGLVELHLVPVDVRKAIRAAIEQCRPGMHARSQRLTIHMPDDLMQVNADPVRLVQVISNLLSNAVKYTSDNGSIDVAVALENDEVLVRVRDNGCGIAADMLPRVFDLFSQADRSSARSQGGLGLGLALVKRIVTLHGGHVEAHSEGVGCGSEFVVRLPRLPPCVDDDSNDIGAPARVSSDGAGTHVLIVDDNRDAADLLATLLQTQGYDVAVEYDSHSAMTRARLERPEIILLDIGLPQIDGHELARRFRANPETASATLIAISGYGQQIDRQRSRQAGFDHHMVKPVAPEQLLAVLRREGVVRLPATR
jgi:CheY-like chemotaxis protein/two-component sensor histidine kinase